MSPSARLAVLSKGRTCVFSLPAMVPAANARRHPRRRLMAVSGTNAQDIRSIPLGKDLPMHALGQKQTCAAQKPMSALPLKADIVDRVEKSASRHDQTFTVTQSTSLGKR